MKKKIHVIGYGGTIMMVVSLERKAVIPATRIEEVLALLPNLNKVADVSFELLTTKDSTNVTPADWGILARYIKENHDKYDGFVITHGTNTMAYTASGLALALGEGLKKPVVITGSQLPLTVYGNDARFNFENSIQTAVVAAEEKIAEVMIVFDDMILRGSRAVKVSESAFSAFASPACPEIGRVRSTGIHFTYHARKASKKPFRIMPEFDNHIVSLDLTPGQSPGLVWSIVLSGNCKGVILKSHGAGSVPTEGEYSFLPLIQKTVHDYKIPVIVSTKFLGGNSYKEVNDECAILAIEAGAIPAGDMTDVMTEVKLMWLLAQGAKTQADVRRMLLNDYVGEITPLPNTQRGRK